jgi:septal ring factor EnvC (AmiA/AmiB activator)
LPFPAGPATAIAAIATGWTSEGEERAMDENAFQKKLAELVQEIGNLPEDDRAKFSALAEQARERHEKLRKTVNSLQDSIDYLRLSIKYLLFDLEATRRENGYLRKMLEEQSGS